MSGEPNLGDVVAQSFSIGFGSSLLVVYHTQLKAEVVLVES